MFAPNPCASASINCATPTSPSAQRRPMAAGSRVDGRLVGWAGVATAATWDRPASRRSSWV
jgi:hypothetical protein